MKAFTLLAGLAAVALAAAEDKQEASKPGRVEIKLPHKGDVFGEGPEWDKQYAREALQIFKDLKPDQAWEAKLAALPENTWMPCHPTGDQQPERGRSEAPMVYMPDVHAFMFCGGCTHPGYSSDTWVYHTGANRWVQMWPNYCKGGEGSKSNKGPYPGNRPATRCSFGLAYDVDRKRAVVHGGANAGPAGKITWQFDPACNEWSILAPAEAGYQKYEANNLGSIPGLGTLEISGAGGGSARPDEVWVLRPTAKGWEKLPSKGSPPGAQVSRLVWASQQKRLVYWTGGSLWAFDPLTNSWEDISPKGGPSPGGFYRQGMAYDSASGVLIMYGSKDEQGKLSQGPWVYSFEKRTWTDMKPSSGPPGNHQQMMMDYDSEYNVVVIACNGRGSWVYRYKRAPEPASKGAER